MKLLGVDFGDFKIGLAIYDSTVDFIYPVTTLIRKRSNILRKSINEIINIVNTENIDKIIIGYPINVDGTIGQRVEATDNFINKLKYKLSNKNIEILVHDERYTSLQAEEMLDDIGYKKKDYKLIVDQVSAMNILKSFREKYNVK